MALTTEQKRVELYKAFKQCCSDKAASQEEIAQVLSYEEPRLASLLDGLVTLRELQVAEVRSVCEDDGFGTRKGFGFDDEPAAKASSGFRLTEFGQRWTILMLAGVRPSERCLQSYVL